MARKIDFLTKRSGQMLTVKPSLITQSFENGNWVGRQVSIVKGWQKVNGAMLPIFDDAPSGPPFTKIVFEAFVGNDSLSDGGSPRVGYHAARRYSGTVRNDQPLGYLLTTSVSQVLSATIGRILATPGGGNTGQWDTLVLMVNDRVINADDSTTIDWAISDVEFEFTPNSGEAQVYATDILPTAMREGTATNPSFRAKFGLLQVAVPTEFMPFPREGRLKITFNKKVP